MNLIEYYSGKIADFNRQLSDKKKELRRFSLYRFIAFVLGFLQFFLFMPINIFLPWGVFVVCFGIFIYFIKKYNAISFRIEVLKEKLSLNERELKAQNWDYSGFKPAPELNNADHAFMNDLDIFEEQGFFQSINRTVTLEGQKILAEELVKKPDDLNVLNERQQTVQNLKDLHNWGQDFLAFSATGLKDASVDSLLKWLLEKNIFLHNKTIHILRFAIPAITLLVVIFNLLGNVPASAVMLMIIIQFTIIGRWLKDINRLHGSTGKQHQNFRNYSELISMIQQQDFEASELLELKETISAHDLNAMKAFKELSLILKRFDYRLNLLMAFVLDGMLLWDLQVVVQLEQWKSKYKDALPQWMNAIYQYEAYISLGNYAFNHPDFIFPEYNSETVLETEALGHPLLDPNVRICNDFNITTQSEFVIITGANMAGKSTFLRTAGLNLMMAYAGLPVCAKSFRFSFFDIFTSMRTNDSLSKNESYFYAELKRLKDLLKRVNSGKRVFVILDEILKGTNSKDKQEGSRMFLKQLVSKGATGIIATHDLDLASLEDENPEKIKNKCFEIEIEGEKIFFDYKLYKGVTQKMNASLLMKQMGLV